MILLSRPGRAARSVAPRALAAITCLALLLLVAGRAGAEVIQAPVGGKAIALGPGRIACGPAPDGWAIGPGGTSIRPPVADGELGSTEDLKVAASSEGCATSTTVIHLAVVGRRPTLDPTSITFYPDEARLEGRGRHLRNATIVWRSNTSSGSSVCRQPKGETAGEQCTFSVGRGLSAAPGAVSLLLLPEGAHAGDDVTSYDADGARVSPDTFAVVPARVVLARLAPDESSIDLSAGHGQVALSHPDVVASVDCQPARCSIVGGNLELRGLASDTNSVDAKVRLSPKTFLQTANGLEPQPTLHLPVLHCPLSVVSGPPLRSTGSARAVVHVGGGCGRDPAVLRFEVAGEPREPQKTVVGPDGADVLLSVGSTDAATVTFSATLAQDPSVVVGTTRADTREPPAVSATVGLPGHPNVDFIPTNRPAVVHTRAPQGGGELVVLPVEGVYRVADEHAGTIVADENTAGMTALRFGLRVPSLPKGLAEENLAVLSDPLQRSIHPANLAAPLGEFAPPGKGLVELLCGAASAPTPVTPGTPSHLPFSTRDDCRLVLHRERLSPAFGTQKLKLAIDVFSADGAPRGDGHVAETIVLRPGTRPLYAWIHGVAAPFDRVVARVSHLADEAHYLGATELASDTPEIKWSIIFGTGRVRLYATSTIPTGLYRFGDAKHSGALSLNLGIVSRLTWLDSEGHEGFLGIEGGIVAFGLTSDKSTTGESLTRVGIVTGLGIGVPVANRSSATEASINLHGWLEHDLSPGSGSGIAFVFGPSISIGNVGANL